jgi:ELWxxDGT repeat protein
VYFAGLSVSTGYDLWATDGTPGGTVLVKDLPGVNSLSFGLPFFTATEDRVFFAVDDDVHGQEPWSSDGTEAGTAMVADLRPGSDPSLLSPYWPTFPRQLGQRLLFQSWDGAGLALTSLDLATSATTSLRSTAEPAASIPLCGFETCPRITATEAGIAFAAVDLAHGSEPWTSDGHPAGTELAADLVPGFWYSLPWNAYRSFAQLPGTLLVIGSDAASDGQVFSISAEGVVQLTDSTAEAGPERIVDWGNAAYFCTEAGLWRTDGTTAGTSLLGGGDCRSSEIVTGTADLFFSTAEGLWATDGSAPGTRRVAPAIDLGVGLMASTDDANGQLIYFTGSDAASGSELWASDGTDEGTRRVVDLRPGPEDGIDPVYASFGTFESSLIARSGRAFFFGNDGTTGEELWTSDGTPGNATLLSVADGPAGSDPRWLAAVGERIYFAADDGVHGREPWSTDGTPDGTQLLADLAPGSASSVPRELTAWGDRVVFAADDGVHGMELWRTGAPGMPSGVPALLDIHPGILPSSPQGFTVSGERLFFFADDGVHGLEPWAWPVGDRLFEDGFESGDASAWEELEPAP